MDDQAPQDAPVVLTPSAGPSAPDPATPALAVVVCGYTPLRFEQLLAAVHEAHRQAVVLGDEVVVVVDHHEDLRRRLEAALSTSDPSPHPRALAGLSAARVTVTANTGPRGLSGARNTGVAVTTAPVLVFLDDDALLRPGALDALRERIAGREVVGVAGAVHADWEGGAAPVWFPPEFGWVVGCDYRGITGHGREVRNPIGAAMAVERDALLAAGGFSTDLGRVGTLPVGCEETLMGIRVREERPGSRIVRDEGFAVDHLVPRGRQTPQYLLRRCFHEGRSKALVARAVGPGAALSSERAYVARSLTAAVLRSGAEVLRGDPSAAARGALVVAGLTSTVLGLVTAPRTASAGPDPTPTPLPAALAADELVTVVVATLGLHPCLVTTVEAALAQSHPAVEVVVVDNAPQHARASTRLAHLDDPRLRIVPQSRRGVSAARNAGIAAARGAVVAFTDDDAVPDPDWVARIVDAFRLDTAGDVAAVTGRVLAATTATEAQEWFETSGIFDKGTTTTTWSLRPRPAGDPLGVAGSHSPFFPFTGGEMGSGNNMAFRSSVLAVVGGFDEALGPGLPSRGGEDLDLLRRVVLTGDTVVYRADAVVRHHHRETVEALREQMYGYGVGMSAVLTKILLGGGPVALLVLKAVPRGVWHLLAPSSPKNADRPAAMPRSLVHVELAGYLVGPIAYVRSRARVARSGRDR